MKLFPILLIIVSSIITPFFAICQSLTEDQIEAIHLKEWVDKNPQEVHTFVEKMMHQMMSEVDPNSIALGSIQKKQFATCAADKIVHHLTNSNKEQLLEQGGILQANEVFAAQCLYEIGVNNSDISNDNQSQSISPPPVEKVDAEEPPVYMLDDCIMRNGRFFDKFKNVPVNGLLASTYESGELMSVVPLTNGIPDGLEQQFYESGNLKLELQYINGKANGVRRTYYESGGIKTEYTYVDGYSEGNGRTYYESGELWLELLNDRGMTVSGYIYNRNGERTKLTSADLSKMNSATRTLK